MNRLFLGVFSLLFVLSIASCHNISIHRRAADSKEIKMLLTKQVAAWNQGNLDGYMLGYWESDSLMFIGKNGPVYGYEATLARYKKAYPDKAAMGQLTSTIRSMDQISRDAVFVVGSWQLLRDAGNLNGSWTLLFKKHKGKWVIVADHSS